MKRKQKTPRRIRPSGSPDVDSGNTPTPTSSEMETKKKKMEAETQTENVDTMKSQVPNIVPKTSKPRSEARFRNEQGSGDMPLILNVFSLSDAAPRAPKQLDVVSRQDNSFPVTPPCSPPLIQLGAFKSIPVMRPSSQVPKRMNPYVRDNTQMFNGNGISANQMANNNPHLIANGVLPFEAQNTCGQQAYVDTNNNPFNGYFNSRVSEAPISQLTNMFQLGNKYLVSKESFVAKGNNGMFTRFKLQHNANASENRPPNERVDLAGKFPQTLTKNTRQCIDPKSGVYGSSKSFSYALQKAAVANAQSNRSDIGVGREACHSSNSVIPMDNQNQPGYLGFQQGYGHNNALHNQTPAVTPTGGSNAPRVSFISNPAPCGPTKGQSCDTDQPPQIAATSSEDESPDFLSPRDARVQRLKRQLEEQMAKLKRLRTSY